MSNDRSPRLDCSMTTGTRPAVGSIMKFSLDAALNVGGAFPTFNRPVVPARSRATRWTFDTRALYPAHTQPRNARMSFLRGAWRFLIGVKDALALLFLLLIFALIFAATRSSAPLAVPSGSALLLDLDGVIVDQASERSAVEVIADTSDVIPEVEVRDVVEAIDRAREDSRVTSIVLQ